jgi:hypothetical protein
LHSLPFDYSKNTYHRGLGQNGENRSVWNNHSEQNQVAQLSGRGLDNGRIVVPQKYNEHHTSEDKAQNCRWDSNNCLNIDPLYEFNRYLEALCNKWKREKNEMKSEEKKAFHEKIGWWKEIGNGRKKKIT